MFLDVSPGGPLTDTMADARVQESIGDPHRCAAAGRIAFTWRLTADQGESCTTSSAVDSSRTSIPARRTSARGELPAAMPCPSAGLMTAARPAGPPRPKRRIAAAGGSERGEWQAGRPCLHCTADRTANTLLRRDNSGIGNGRGDGPCN